jgi:phosphotransferase system HPr (HPr) family protein
VARLEQGDGVVVLTDMYGGTPSNIASRLIDPGKVEAVAGVSLPMLVRALSYSSQPLEIVVSKAITGGLEGVLYILPGTVMLRVEIQIINKLGLHARASSKFTQLASRFKSDVGIARNGRRVNGKSIMGVMMLAAAKGSTVELDVDGPDEQEALDALVALINNRFDEAE